MFGKKKGKDPAEMNSGEFDDDFMSGLDDFDSELEGFDLEGDDIDSEKMRKPSGPVQSAKKAFQAVGGGILEGSASAIGATIEKSLPNVSKAFDDGMRVASDAMRLKDDVVAEIGPVVNQTKVLGRQLMGHYKELIPTKLYDKIDKMLATSQEEQTASKTPSKEDMRAQAMQQEFSNIFKAQHETAKLDRQQATINRVIDTRMAESRHQEITSLVHDIRNQAYFQTQFTRSTFTAYLKKDLELKYKHLYVAEDTMELLRVTAEMQEKRLDAIRHNTALPDAQKIHKMELLKQKLYTSLQDRLFNYTGLIGKKIKDNFVEPAKDMFGGFNDMMSMMLTQIDMENDMGQFSAKKNIMGKVGEFVGKSFMGNFMKKRLAKMDPKARAMLNNYGSQGLPGLILFAEALRDGHYSFEGSDKYRDILQMILPDSEKNKLGTFTNKAFKDSEGDGRITNRFITTVEEIIPRYLAKQTMYLAKIATGRDHEELVYDTKTHDFIGIGQARKEFEDAAFGSSRQVNARMLHEHAEMFRGNLRYDKKRGSAKVKKFDEYDKEITLFIHAHVINHFPKLNLEEIEYVKRTGTVESEYAKQVFGNAVTKKPKELAEVIWGLIHDYSGRPDDVLIGTIDAQIIKSIQSHSDIFYRSAQSAMTRFGFQGNIVNQIYDIDEKTGDYQLSRAANMERMSYVDREHIKSTATFDPNKDFGDTSPSGWQALKNVWNELEIGENIKAGWQKLTSSMVEWFDGIAASMKLTKQWNGLKAAWNKGWHATCEFFMGEKGLIPRLKKQCWSIYQALCENAHNYLVNLPFAQNDEWKTLFGLIFTTDAKPVIRTGQQAPDAVEIAQFLLKFPKMHKLLSQLESSNNPVLYMLFLLLPEPMKIVGRMPADILEQIDAGTARSLARDKRRGTVQSALTGNKKAKELADAITHFQAPSRFKTVTEDYDEKKHGADAKRRLVEEVDIFSGYKKSKWVVDKEVELSDAEYEREYIRAYNDIVKKQEEFANDVKAREEMVIEDVPFEELPDELKEILKLTDFSNPQQKSYAHALVAKHKQDMRFTAMNDALASTQNLENRYLSPQELKKRTTAISKRRRSLKKEGKTKDEIDAIIEKEFYDKAKQPMPKELQERIDNFIKNPSEEMKSKNEEFKKAAAEEAQKKSEEEAVKQREEDRKNAREEFMKKTREEIASKDNIQLPKDWVHFDRFKGMSSTEVLEIVRKQEESRIESKLSEAMKKYDEDLAAKDKADAEARQKAEEEAAKKEAERLEKEKAAKEKEDQKKAADAAKAGEATITVDPEVQRQKDEEARLARLASDNKLKQFLINNALVVNGQATASSAYAKGDSRFDYDNAKAAGFSGGSDAFSHHITSGNLFNELLGISDANESKRNAASKAAQQARREELRKLGKTAEEITEILTQERIAAGTSGSTIYDGATGQFTGDSLEKILLAPVLQLDKEGKNKSNLYMEVLQAQKDGTNKKVKVLNPNSITERARLAREYIAEQVRLENQRRVEQVLTDYKGDEEATREFIRAKGNDFFMRVDTRAIDEYEKLATLNVTDPFAKQDTQEKAAAYALRMKKEQMKANDAVEKLKSDLKASGYSESEIEQQVNASFGSNSNMSDYLRQQMQRQNVKEDEINRRLRDVRTYNLQIFAEIRWPVANAFVESNQMIKEDERKFRDYVGSPEAATEVENEIIKQKGDLKILDVDEICSAAEKIYSEWYKKNHTKTQAELDQLEAKKVNAAADVQGGRLYQTQMKSAGEEGRKYAQSNTAATRSEGFFGLIEIGDEQVDELRLANQFHEQANAYLRQIADTVTLFGQNQELMADGGLISGKDRAGIVNKPTLIAGGRAVAGEHGKEAIVPLNHTAAAQEAYLQAKAFHEGKVFAEGGIPDKEGKKSDGWNIARRIGNFFVPKGVADAAESAAKSSVWGNIKGMWTKAADEAGLSHGIGDVKTMAKEDTAAAKAQTKAWWDAGINKLQGVTDNPDEISAMVDKFYEKLTAFQAKVEKAEAENKGIGLVAKADVISILQELRKKSMVDALHPSDQLLAKRILKCFRNKDFTLTDIKRISKNTHPGFISVVRQYQGLSVTPGELLNTARDAVTKGLDKAREVGESLAEKGDGWFKKITGGAGTFLKGASTLIGGGLALAGRGMGWAGNKLGGFAGTGGPGGGMGGVIGGGVAKKQLKTLIAIKNMMAILTHHITGLSDFTKIPGFTEGDADLNVDGVPKGLWGKTKYYGAKAGRAIGHGLKVGLWDTPINAIKTTHRIGRDSMFNISDEVHVKPIGNQPLGADTLRISREQFQAGVYTDMQGKNRVKSIHDIKTIVYDENGYPLLSEEDLKRGLVDKDGVPLVTVGSKVGRAIHGAAATSINKVLDTGVMLKDNAVKAWNSRGGKFVRNAVMGTLGAPFGFTKGLVQKFVDVYEKDQVHKGPIVTAKQLRAGLVVYLDGKPPMSSYTINEPMMYTNSELNGANAGQMAITHEQVANGLVDKNNKPLTKLSAAMGAMTGAALKAGAKFLGFLGMGAGSLLGTITAKGWKLITDKPDQFIDVYTPNADGKVEPGNPRLTGSGIKDGQYVYAGTKKPLTSAYGIAEDNILDTKTGKVVLTADEVKKGLYDIRGKKLTSFRGRSILGKTLTAIPNAAAWAGRKLWSGTKKIYNAIKDKSKGLFSAGRDIVDWGKGILGDAWGALMGANDIKKVDLEEMIGKRLDKIYDLLDLRMPGRKTAGDIDGDGIREGSAEDQKKKREEKEAIAQKRREVREARLKGKEAPVAATPQAKSQEALEKEMPDELKLTPEERKIWTKYNSYKRKDAKAKFYEKNKAAIDEIERKLKAQEDWKEKNKYAGMNLIDKYKAKAQDWLEDKKQQGMDWLEEKKDSIKDYAMEKFRKSKLGQAVDRYKQKGVDLLESKKKQGRKWLESQKKDLRKKGVGKFLKGKGKGAWNMLKNGATGLGGMLLSGDDGYDEEDWGQDRFMDDFTDTNMEDVRKSRKDKLKQKAKKGWDKTKKLGKRGLKGARSLGGRALNLLKGGGGRLGSLAMNVGRTALTSMSGLGGIGSALGGLGSTIMGGLGTAGSALAGMAGTAGTALAGLAGTAGTAIAGGLASAGSALAGGLGAAAGLVSNPIGWAIGAGLALYGGYKLLSWAFSDSDNEKNWWNARCKAYGIKPDDKQAKVIKKLEDRAVDAIDGTNKDLDDSELEDLAIDLGIYSKQGLLKSFASFFGIGSGDDLKKLQKEQMDYTATWYTQRFRPAFEQFLITVRSITHKDMGDCRPRGIPNVDNIPEDQQENALKSFESNVSQYVNSPIVPTKEGFDAYRKKYGPTVDQMKEGGGSEAAARALVDMGPLIDAVEKKKEQADQKEEAKAKDTNATSTQEKIADYLKDGAALAGDPSAKDFTARDKKSLSFRKFGTGKDVTKSKAIWSGSTESEKEPFIKNGILSKLDKIKDKLSVKGTLDRVMGAKDWLLEKGASVKDAISNKFSNIVSSVSNLFSSDKSESSSTKEGEESIDQQKLNVLKSIDEKVGTILESVEMGFGISTRGTRKVKKESAIDQVGKALAGSMKASAGGSSSGAFGGSASGSSTPQTKSIFDKTPDPALGKLDPNAEGSITGSGPSGVSISGGGGPAAGAVGGPSGTAPTGASAVDLSKVAANSGITDTGGDVGSYVKKFESGKGGASTVAWDSTGGTSYGTYQFAAKPGGFGDFIKWASQKGGPFGKQLADEESAVKPWDTGSKTGPAVDVWKKFASVEGGKPLHQLEHAHMWERMEQAMSKLDPQDKQMIKSDRGLQEAWWSTVVQHGPGGARSVFTKAKARVQGQLTPQSWIRAIYEERSTRFGSSTPKVRASVQNRFKEEVGIILALSGKPGSGGEGQPANNTAVASADQANPAAAPATDENGQNIPKDQQGQQGDTTAAQAAGNNAGGTLVADASGQTGTASGGGDATGSNMPDSAASSTPSPAPSAGGEAAAGTPTAQASTEGATPGTEATQASAGGDGGTGSAMSVKAADEITSAAGKESKHACAKYVRTGLQKAGYKFESQPSAYQYATNGIMESMGFSPIDPGSAHAKGDVAVIGANSKHKHGHIQIWNGSTWVSDFVQNPSKMGPYKGPSGVESDQFLKVYRDLKGGASAPTPGDQQQSDPNNVATTESPDTGSTAAQAGASTDGITSDTSMASAGTSGTGTPSAGGPGIIAQAGGFLGDKMGGSIGDMIKQGANTLDGMFGSKAGGMLASLTGGSGGMLGGLADKAKGMLGGLGGVFGGSNPTGTSNPAIAASVNKTIDQAYNQPAAQVSTSAPATATVASSGSSTGASPTVTTETPSQTGSIGGGISGDVHLAELKLITQVLGGIREDMKGYFGGGNKSPEQSGTTTPNQSNPTIPQSGQTAVAQAPATSQNQQQIAGTAQVVTAFQSGGDGYNAIQEAVKAAMGSNGQQAAPTISASNTIDTKKASFVEAFA